MESNISFFYVKDQKDIDHFWKIRNQYFLEDIIPNREIGGTFCEGEKEWFFSKEYKNHIMMLFERTVDPLYIVLINQGHTNIGFMTYVIYNSEDGKCFILDYCIFQQYRSQSIGEIAFNLLEKDFINKGATYIDLNISNFRNEKFWIKNGFLKTSIQDARNKFIYRKIL